MEDNIDEYCLFLCRIPKEVPKCRLCALLAREVAPTEWELLQLLPLEESYLAVVSCRTCETYERFAAFDFSSLSSDALQHMYTVNALPPRAAASASSLLDLPHDCLALIFAQYCNLKSQLALTKVCQHFHALITDIWRQQHKVFYYNLYDFEFKHDLRAEEVHDFCAIVGPHVRQLRFNTIFYAALIQRPQLCVHGMLRQAKEYLNSDLCRNLQHFPQLHTFEVEGKFLSDFTVRELARYCPQLRVFRLLDANTRWLRGKHFGAFTQLQHLELRDCKSLKRKHLSSACARNPQLRVLDIVECETLHEAKYVAQLCRSGKLACLAALQLNAVAVANACKLTVILCELRQLQHLQFYWKNDWPGFEDLLLAALLRYKDTALCGLRLCNDRIFIENESQEKLTAYNYALMRENVVLKGHDWTWRDKFEKLAKFAHLARLSCEYCRPLAPAELLQLPQLCGNLQYIQLIGCAQPEDAELRADWLELSRRQKCELHIEGLITVVTLQQMRQRLQQMPYRRQTFKEPLMRSISCYFQ